MIELLGWTSSILFSLSAAPQAYKTYKQGHAKGISYGMLWLWFIGEMMALIYGVLVDLPLPIMMNYAINGVFLLIIMRYRYFARTKED